MNNQAGKQTSRFVYLLTERGHNKLMEKFVKRTGEMYDYNSVSDLDWRTVRRICMNRIPGHLASLMVLFRTINLRLEPEDYFQVARGPQSALGRPDEATGVTQPPDPTTLTERRGDEFEQEDAGEPDGGAEPLVSTFYIERQLDAQLKAAIRRKDSTILIKGPRHCGKSSLLARGFEEARALGFQTACTDVDSLDSERLESKDTLYRAFANSLALQCGAEDPSERWRTDYSPAEKLEFYLRRYLKGCSTHLIWALDGVDALVGCGFHEDVFAMFRAWHNARRNEPGGPWDRLTVILSYATEASLLISSTALSPFNVAKPLIVDDFTRSELAELNRRYGGPLSSDEEEVRLLEMCGGHPFLTRLALYELKSGQSTLNDLGRMAASDGGIFRPYLDEIRVGLRHDPEYRNLVTLVATGQKIVQSVEVNRCFQRLRSAGVLKGNSSENAAFRCELYRMHFSKYPVNIT